MNKRGGWTLVKSKEKEKGEGLRRENGIDFPIRKK